MAFQLTEGDIVKHVDGSLWVVKGCVHPPEGYVSIPRVLDGRKLKRLADALELVKRYYFHYVKNVPEVGREVPVVPLVDILSVRRWSVEGRKCDDVLLCQLLQTFEALGLNCGVAGSHLGGYSGAESDVDIHCLDNPGAYDKVASLYSLGILKHLDLGEASREVAEVHESLDPKRHAELIARRYLQGAYKRKRITIRMIDCDRVRRFLGPYTDSRRAELIVKIAESDYRTPAIMRADVVRAPVAVDRDTYLLTHRLRFIELPTGTLLCVNGTIMTNALGNSIVNLDESEVVWVSLPTEGAKHFE